MRSASMSITVASRSAGRAAGLVPGDMIVSVGGNSTVNLPRSGFEALLSGQDGGIGSQHDDVGFRPSARDNRQLVGECTRAEAVEVPAAGAAGTNKTVWLLDVEAASQIKA